MLHFPFGNRVVAARPSDNVEGFEGLARWEHPTLGLLTPDRFIHLVTVSDEGPPFAEGYRDDRPGVVVFRIDPTRVTSYLGDG